MRLISIESDNQENVVVNTDQICQIFMSEDRVFITLADDRSVETKFTDVKHAVDYIQRAASCTFSKA